LQFARTIRQKSDTSRPKLRRYAHDCGKLGIGQLLEFRGEFCIFAAVEFGQRGV